MEKKTLNRFVVLAALVVAVIFNLLFVAGCGESENPPANGGEESEADSGEPELKMCVPGVTAECSCPNYRAGATTCRGDGMGWGECNCPTMCDPGDYQVCPCADSKDSQGVQVCTEDGNRWGQCECAPTPMLCEPGRTITCACTGGETGAQACAQDGLSWSMCFCPEPSEGEGEGEGEGEIQTDYTCEDSWEECPAVPCMLIAYCQGSTHTCVYQQVACPNGSHCAFDNESSWCTNSCLTPGECLVGQICLNTVCQNPPVEICDGVDNDFDGATDEDTACALCPNGPTSLFYRDDDNDGEGAGEGVRMCAGAPLPGWVGTNGDCDDQNAVIYPTATETCDGLDNNCDGETDEGFWLGYGCGVGQCDVPGTVLECGDNGYNSCPTGPNGRDDRSSPEICDGVDNDCDSATDENGVCEPQEHVLEVRRLAEPVFPDGVPPAMTVEFYSENDDVRITGLGIRVEGDVIQSLALRTWRGDTEPITYPLNIVLSVGIWSVFDIVAEPIAQENWPNEHPNFRLCLEEVAAENRDSGEPLAVELEGSDEPLCGEWITLSAE